MTIGEKIAMLRKERHITQTELAEYLFLVPQTISKWEVGSGVPEISLLPKIAAFFGVSIDELFGISSLEHAKDVVMKYSVLRDDASFREAMECLKSQIQTIDASLNSGIGDREELESEKVELESWMMHLLLQQSWESAQRALKLAESLVQKTQRMPYKLQRIQLRHMLGYGRQDLQECEEAFRESPCLDTLQIYFEMLSLVQKDEIILELQESDQAVIALMMPPSEENIVLWGQCAFAAEKVKNLEYCEQYGEHIMQYGTVEDKYFLLRILTALYKEKGMDKKYSEAKEKLFSLLEELPDTYSAYWHEREKNTLKKL